MVQLVSFVSVTRTSIRRQRPLTLRVSWVPQSCTRRSVRCLFDTGAQDGYVITEQLVEGGTPDGRINDFNPIIGTIESAAWREEVELGAVRFTERFGLLTGPAAAMLKMVGVDAFIGPSWLHTRTLWYQPGLRRISISAAR